MAKPCRLWSRRNRQLTERKAVAHSGALLILSAGVAATHNAPRLEGA